MFWRLGGKGWINYSVSKMFVEKLVYTGSGTYTDPVGEGEVFACIAENSNWIFDKYNRTSSVEERKNTIEVNKFNWVFYQPSFDRSFRQIQLNSLY